jgi:hypothetical protein
MAGKFEELRSLEELSDHGVPFAMYWWGHLMMFCLFEPCDAERAVQLIRSAARAGHGRAQAVVFTVATGLSEKVTTHLGVIAGVGVPKDGYARLKHAIYLSERHKRSDPKARADFVALATSVRQVGLLAHLVELEGVLTREDALRAIALSGYFGVSDRVRQLEIIKGTTYEQMLERARAGELWLATAYCDTAGIETGDPTLQPDTLSVCERAAAQGFPGAVRALLRHHHHTKNQRAADYFAGVCDALLGANSAKDVAAYYHDRRGESADLRAKWELWNLAANTSVQAQALRNRDEGLRRSLAMLIVRSILVEEACLMQRVDVKTGAREADPECPWRVPIAIPAELLSGAR